MAVAVVAIDGGGDRGTAVVKRERTDEAEMTESEEESGHAAARQMATTRAPTPTRAAASTSGYGSSTPLYKCDLLDPAVRRRLQDIINASIAVLPDDITNRFGDVVWVKMNGFPYWPALVLDPRALAPKQQIQAVKSCDSSYWLYFFGSQNFGSAVFKDVIPWADLRSPEFRNGFPASAAQAPKRRELLLLAIKEADVHADVLASSHLCRVLTTVGEQAEALRSANERLGMFAAAQLPPPRSQIRPSQRVHRDQPTSDTAAALKQSPMLVPSPPASDQLQEMRTTDANPERRSARQEQRAALEKPRRSSERQREITEKTANANQSEEKRAAAARRAARMEARSHKRPARVERKARPSRRAKTVEPTRAPESRSASSEGRSTPTNRKPSGSDNARTTNSNGLSELSTIVIKLKSISVGTRYRTNWEAMSILNGLLRRKDLDEEDAESSGLLALIATLEKSENANVSKTADALRGHLKSLFKKKESSLGALLKHQNRYCIPEKEAASLLSDTEVPAATEPEEVSVPMRSSRASRNAPDRNAIAEMEKASAERETFIDKQVETILELRRRRRVPRQEPTREVTADGEPSAENSVEPDEVSTDAKTRAAVAKPLTGARDERAEPHQEQNREASKTELSKAVDSQKHTRLRKRNHIMETSSEDEDDEPQIIMTKKPTVTVDPPPPVPVARIAAPNAAPKAASNATPNALPSSALSAVASNAAPIASPAASPTRSAATTPENETAGAPHKRIKRCNPAMVVFTMDGTLVDFNSLWGGWVESQAFRLEVAAKLARAKFFQAFGYDYQNRCLFRGSLLTMMPKQQLSKVAVELLVREGRTVDHAKKLVTECWTLPDLASTCQPLCDLVALFKTLNHLDIRIAICTTDTRANTVAALQKLRVDRHVDAIACSDDGFPPKPSPQLIWALCRQLNASAQNTVLVGSTATDMALGHNSGCGLSIGFLGGGVSRIEDLSVAADVLVGSLDKIVKVLFQYTQQALRTEQ